MRGCTACFFEFFARASYTRILLVLSREDPHLPLFRSRSFVDEYPQLWRWTDEQFPYGKTCENADGEGGCGRAEPREVLLASPTLAALLPPAEMARPLGGAFRSGGQWEELAAFHHIGLRLPRARALGAAAAAVLAGLPTTVAEDEVLLQDARTQHEEEERGRGRADAHRADAIQAIEYRLAFKKALTLTVKVAEGNDFLVDPGEKWDLTKAKEI